MHKLTLYVLFLIAFSKVTIAQNTKKDSLKNDSPNTWLQGKCEWLLSPSLNHYYSNSFRYKNGTKEDFSNSGSYQNYVSKIYFVAPLKAHKINIWGNIPYVSSRYKDDTTTQQNGELGDVELGVKIHLKNIGKHHFLMGSFATVIPFYDNDITPYNGFGEFGNELKLILSGNSEWMDINRNFHSIEVGVKYFYGDGPVQFKLYGNKGYRFSKRLTLLGDAEVLISNSSNDFFLQNNTQIISNFSVIKASLNLGYTFNSNFELYGGFFKDLWNSNMAIGSGFQIFGVLKL